MEFASKIVAEYLNDKPNEEMWKFFGLESDCNLEQERKVML